MPDSRRGSRYNRPWHGGMPRPFQTMLRGRFYRRSALLHRHLLPRDRGRDAIRELDGFLTDSRRTSSPCVRGTFDWSRLTASPHLNRHLEEVVLGLASSFYVRPSRVHQALLTPCRVLAKCLASIVQLSGEGSCATSQCSYECLPCHVARQGRTRLSVSQSREYTLREDHAYGRTHSRCNLHQDSTCPCG